MRKFLLIIVLVIGIFSGCQTTPKEGYFKIVNVPRVTPEGITILDVTLNPANPAGSLKRVVIQKPDQVKIRNGFVYLEVTQTDNGELVYSPATPPD